MAFDKLKEWIEKFDEIAMQREAMNIERDAMLLQQQLHDSIENADHLNDKEKEHLHQFFQAGTAEEKEIALESIKQDINEIPVEYEAFAETRMALEQNVEFLTKQVFQLQKELEHAYTIYQNGNKDWLTYCEKSGVSEEQRESLMKDMQKIDKNYQACEAKQAELDLAIQKKNAYALVVASVKGKEQELADAIAVTEIIPDQEELKRETAELHRDIEQTNNSFLQTLADKMYELSPKMAYSLSEFVTVQQVKSDAKAISDGIKKVEEQKKELHEKQERLIRLAARKSKDKELQQMLRGKAVPMDKKMDRAIEVIRKHELEGHSIAKLQREIEKANEKIQLQMKKIDERAQSLSEREASRIERLKYIAATSRNGQQFAQKKTQTMDREVADAFSSIKNLDTRGQYLSEYASTEFQLNNFDMSDQNATTQTSLENDSFVSDVAQSVEEIQNADGIPVKEINVEKNAPTASSMDDKLNVNIDKETGMKIFESLSRDQQWKLLSDEMSWGDAVNEFVRTSGHERTQTRDELDYEDQERTPFDDMLVEEYGNYEMTDEELEQYNQDFEDRDFS